MGGIRGKAAAARHPYIFADGTKDACSVVSQCERRNPMRHEDTKRLIPAAHLEVEPPDVLDELYEIGNAIDLAALAVIGMADELGGIEGHLLANYLRDRAELIRKAVERLSPNRPATVQAKPGNLEQLDRES
jgi:hypothetical protein